jgi:RNA polymerase sigma-70 factor, ECF subfamily
MRKRKLATVSTAVIPAEIIADRNAPNPEKQFKSKEKEALMENLLNELKPTDRAAIVLRYWHDYSEVQIAQALGLTVSAVKSRLYRARRTLAESWQNLDRSTTLAERRTHESPAF